MRSRNLILALVAGLGLAAATQAEMYNAQYLAPFALPAAMNQDGTVVGWNPVYRTPFVYEDKSGYAALPCPKAYLDCEAVDINDAGWIAGSARVPGVLALRVAVLWTPIGASPDAPAAYRFGLLPWLGNFNHSEAIAIDNQNRVVGLRQVVRVGLPQTPESFVWSAKTGMRRLEVPGPVVDLNDAGWVAGNSKAPYLYRISDGRLLWTRMPPGFVSATAHALGEDGTVVGALVNDLGLSIAARTEDDGSWTALGGGGASDHLFGINRFGDVAGHVHGLDPASHCGVQFAEEGELKTLESLFHPRAQTWTMGEAITGPTDGRWLAGQAVNAKSGLPALVRLVPGKAEACGAACLWVSRLEIEPRTGVPSPGWRAVAQLGGTVQGVAKKYVDATWIHDGGAIVERRQYEVGRDGSAILTTAVKSKTVQLYVTSVFAAGHTFDPTRGVLYAAR
jgi:hypothetical protein